MAHYPFKFSLTHFTIVVCHHVVITVGQLLGDVFADLPELIEIDLRENDLRGPLPSELCQLHHLEGLYLYGNRLSGHIPLSLADPPRRDTLTGVFLFNNEFDNALEARKHFQQTLRSDCYVYV